jgi:nucleoside-triphosphatase THEP1
LTDQNRDIWLKAAVVGSLWGASEIVLGSFLHNLRIPFSSNLLTAIGILLMIAGHRLWPQRGLIWRAGIICAALKTLSPSHAIFGPMIAISAQALLMQGAVVLGGRNPAAYLAGGGLAMSWNLVQRILTALIVYGASMVDLYQRTVDYLFVNTGLSFPGYWTPLWVLASLFFAGGMLAAVLGIMVSRSTKKTNPIAWDSLSPSGLRQKHEADIPSHSSTWTPLLILAILISALLLLQKLSALPSILMVTSLLTIAAWYDRTLLRGVLQKPGFWIGLFILALLSGLLLGKEPSQHWLSVEGLQTGMNMGLRALVVITGFRALGRELRNPALTRWFRQRNLGNFLMASRIAFQTTPLLLEILPKRESWKRPGDALQQLAGNLEPALEYMKSRQPQPGVVILTGGRGSGKTTTVLNLAQRLREEGHSIAGIAAPAVMLEGKRTGYLIRDLSTGQEVPYATRTGESHQDNPIPFSFLEDGHDFGIQVLKRPAALKSDLLIVDEAGPLELKGKGWAEPLRDLLSRRIGPTLLVVRPSLIDSITSLWALGDPVMLEVEEMPEEEILGKIREILTS